jgi:N-acetylglucosaminyldiphosphoundecaprenol N-acetyl-beta-D-mannosaminyltransferase
VTSVSDAAPPFRFGSLDLAPFTSAETADWIEQRAIEGTPCIVVTSNISHLRLAQVHAEFRDVVRRSELNVADGWPLVLASRLLRKPVPARVAGIDLVDAVLSSPTCFRLAVLGGPPGAAEELGRRASPTNDVVFVDPLPRGRWDRAGAIGSLRDAVAAARPNLVLIGLGPPRQELLADVLRTAVEGPIICCGASIEVLAGLRPRAPRSLQRSGLEWAFRLALEPRRLAARYARSGFWFLRVLVRELAVSAREPRPDAGDGLPLRSSPVDDHSLTGADMSRPEPRSGGHSHSRSG